MADPPIGQPQRMVPRVQDFAGQRWNLLTPFAWVTSFFSERKARRMSDSQIKVLLENAREDVDAIVALVKAVTTDQRSWSDIARPLFAAVSALAESAGRLWDYLRDKRARPDAIKGAILYGLSEAEIDLPGKDERMVGLAVDAAVGYWRLTRGKPELEG